MKCFSRDIQLKALKVRHTGSIIDKRLIVNHPSKHKKYTKI